MPPPNRCAALASNAAVSGMPALQKGRYLAREAKTPADVIRAQTLRALCFGIPNTTLDQDRFDPLCTHVLLEDAISGELRCCFRLLRLLPPAIDSSYSAQFYDLARLQNYPGPALELGRFCIHPGQSDPDILRLAWAFLTQMVDAGGVQLLFGCASLNGTNPTQHLDAFARLHAKHQAPLHWAPSQKSPTRFDFKTELAGHKIDPRRAQTTIPALLRSYLMMGGWVSDHAVYDHDLRTMHVFTAVEIAKIPTARARLLRALAES
jgi:putative hemolysin